MTPPAPALSGTTLTVKAGDGALFPAAPFNVTVWPAGVPATAGNAEIVRVTNKGTGDNWTVTRTQEGTAARPIVVGYQVAATVTAKTLTDVEAAEAADAAAIAALGTTVGGHTSSIGTLTAAEAADAAAISSLNGTVAGHTSSIGTLTSFAGSGGTLDGRLAVVEAALPPVQVLARESKILFDQVLAATGPTIDTGAGGIPGGYAYIEALITAATDFPGVAVTTTAGGIQVNADAGANYFYESLLDANGVYGGSNNQTTPDSGVLRINMPGATAGAGSLCIARCIFHNYDVTTLNKIALLEHTMFDPTAAANGRTRVTAAYWKSTAAITRLALLMKSNNLLAGSRLTIIGHGRP